MLLETIAWSCRRPASVHRSDTDPKGYIVIAMQALISRKFLDILVITSNSARYPGSQLVEGCNLSNLSNGSLISSRHNLNWKPHCNISHPSDTD
jgi:hypothetical protein